MTEDTSIKEGVLFDGQYKLLKLLSASGGSADVWLALDKNAVDLVAESEEDSEDKGEPLRVVIKIYRPKNALDIEGEQRFRDEFKIVYNCHHENLLQSTYFSISNDRPYLVMPFCQRGSTETLIGKFGSDKDIWNYIYDVASGIAYLHDRKPPIIHQDIKPANILINDDGRYAITDFGISAQPGHSHNDLFEENSCGTIAYMAPERFSEDSLPNAASDVWALGATFYEMVTGYVPFGEEGGSAQMASTALPKIKEKVDKDIKRLIYSCLDYNVGKRPTAQTIHLFAKRKIERDRSRKIMAAVLSVIIPLTIALITVLSKASSTTQQFEDLCANGDKIIQTIKTTKIRQGYSNDTLKTRLSQAKTIYEQALKVEIDDAKQKQSVRDKIKIITSIQQQCRTYQLYGDSVKWAETFPDDDFGYMKDDYQKAQDSVFEIITKQIEYL